MREKKMRLSEAILLGSTMVKAVGGQYLKNGEGCAIGMALKSSGIVAGDSLSEQMSEATDALREKFPILTELVEAPCECYPEVRGGYSNIVRIPKPKHTVYGIIVHLFDLHVKQMAQFDWECYQQKVTSWTLEKICDWIDSIDPSAKDKTKELPVIEAGLVAPDQIPVESVESAKVEKELVTT